MLSNRFVYRLAVASASTVGVLLTGVLMAAPAYAADAVDVSLGAPSSATPGRPGSITVRLQNETDNEIYPVRTIFTIRMGGLSVDGVRMTQGRELLARSGSDGEVRFTAGLQVRLAPDGDRGESSTAGYAIIFDNGVPGGRAEIVAEAYQGTTRLGGESDSISVRAGRGVTSTTPPNTNPGIIPTFEARPTYSLAPLDESSPLEGVDPGFPPIFYVMGAILLGVGGVLLWLLYRQRGSEVAEVAGTPPTARTMQFPGLRPSRGPGRHAVHQPTATLPTVPGPRPARADHLQPPSDPWATRGRPTDRTREFDPFED